VLPVVCRQRRLGWGNVGAIRVERRPRHMGMIAQICIDRVTAGHAACSRPSLIGIGSIEQIETIEEPPNVCCVGSKEGSQPRWIAKLTNWQN
jgi:hypothetical protein